MNGRANVFDGITAVLSGRAARRIYYWAHLDQFAEKVRGRDPELDQALETLRVAGERWARSESGTPTPSPAEPRPEWVTTREAAEMLGMTDRGVRKAIADDRLPADCSGGPWLIHREHLAHFAATRKAS